MQERRYTSRTFATRRVAPTLVLGVNMLPAYVHTLALKKDAMQERRVTARTFATRRVAPTLVLGVNTLPAYVHTLALKKDAMQERRVTARTFATRRVAPTLVLGVNTLPAYVHTLELKKGCHAGAPLHGANIRDPEGRSYRNRDKADGWLGIRNTYLVSSFQGPSTRIKKAGTF